MFRLDEKSGVHALDRLDRVLPLSPGRAERHGFEYYRHGTLSRFAALNTRTGTVRGQTAPCHTTEEFVAFLAQLVALAPPGRESTSCWITLPVTKLSAFTNSWPSILMLTCTSLRPTPLANQVELWFAKIERHFIARGIFTSVKDLARKLMRFIRVHNRSARPIKWSYCDSLHRITFEACVTIH